MFWIGRGTPNVYSVMTVKDHSLISASPEEASCTVVRTSLGKCPCNDSAYLACRTVSCLCNTFLPARSFLAYMSLSCLYDTFLRISHFLSYMTLSCLYDNFLRI